MLCWWSWWSSPASRFWVTDRKDENPMVVLKIETCDTFNRISPRNNGESQENVGKEWYNGIYIYIYWLVVEPTPLKNHGIGQLGWWFIPNWMENRNPFMFQSTNILVGFFPINQPFWDSHHGYGKLHTGTTNQDMRIRQDAPFSPSQCGAQFERTRFQTCRGPSYHPLCASGMMQCHA